MRIYQSTNTNQNNEYNLEVVIMKKTKTRLLLNGDSTTTTNKDIDLIKFELQKRPLTDKFRNNPYKMIYNQLKCSSTACCMILLYISLSLISNLAAGQLDLSAASSSSGSSSPSSPDLNNQLNVQQEILVQPSSQVKIPCKLPQVASSEHRSFSWMFQASAAPKPRIVCFDTKCKGEANNGVQLYMDSEAKTYDLMISNVTYELHDGLYYCEYEDLTPESKLAMIREYRLTVLSKYHYSSFLTYLFSSGYPLFYIC